MGTRWILKTEVLGMLDDVGHAIPNKPKPPSWKNRTTKLLIKTLSLSTITTTLIVIIGIYSAFSFFNPFTNNFPFDPQSKYRPFALSLKDVDTLAAYQLEEIDAPSDRILSPTPGASSHRHLKITGITRNIPEDHYVVLVVDVESQRVSKGNNDD